MSDSHLPIQLLTVDAAGTLVRPWPSVGAVYGRTAREYGIDASDEDVDKNFYQAFGKLQVCKKTNGGEEKEFWRQVVAETFRPFSGDKDIDPLFEDLWNLFARGDCWKLAEGAMDTLKTLQSVAMNSRFFPTTTPASAPCLPTFKSTRFFITSSSPVKWAAKNRIPKYSARWKKPPARNRPIFSTWATVIPGTI